MSGYETTTAGDGRSQEAKEMSLGHAFVYFALYYTLATRALLRKCDLNI